MKDLGAVFFSHTTGCPDSAPAPEIFLPRQIRKASKENVNVPRCPVLPASTTRGPVCLDEQALPSVDKHKYTKATEGTAPSRAQEEWVVVLPQKQTKAPKKSVKASRRPVVPASTTPRWKVSKFKQHVKHNTRNWCKAYGKANTTSHLDQCWALPSGGAWRLLR